MKKYLFRLKMTSKNGGTSYTIIGAHPAADVAALADELNAHDFVCVETFFEDAATGDLAPAGPVVINQRVIGTVREWKVRQRSRFVGQDAME